MGQWAERVNGKPSILKPIPPPFGGRMIDPDDQRVKSKSRYIGVNSVIGKSLNNRSRYQN